MVKLSETEIPPIGEAVNVAWGLGSLPGRVVEVYEGARARVVVELDAGTVDDLATTVTVPLAAVNPIDTSNTPWAQRARYERAVATALRRIGKPVAQIDSGVVEGGREIDILAEAEDGQQIVIETKSQPISEAALRAASRQAAAAASALGAVWLVVAPDLVGTAAGAKVHFAQWRDESDDAKLRQAVLDALSPTRSTRR